MENNLYYYKSVITRVIDGDTVCAKLYIGFYATIELKFRLLRINAPERYTKEGKEATAFVEGCLLNREVIIRTYKSDSFGRWLADIFIETKDGWKSFNDMLLELGLAVPYK